MLRVNVCLRGSLGGAGMVELNEKLREEFRTWLSCVVECIAESDGAGGQGILEILKSTYGSDLDSRQYSYYCRTDELTTEELNDLAEILLRQYVRDADPQLVRAVMVGMTDKDEILLDERKSSCWLSPIALAERTSIAYERGVRLIKKAHGSSKERYLEKARLVMMGAANKGDVHCAQYLIKNKILGEAAYGDRMSAWMKKANKTIVFRSLMYDRAMQYVVVKNFAKAEELLSMGASSGDVNCIVYMIKQKLRKEAQDIVTRQLNLGQISEEVVMNLKLGHETWEEFIRSMVPITIAWERDAIVQFLLQQYKEGNEEAADLLYLQLHNEMRAWALERNGNVPIESVRKFVRGRSDFPSSIIALVLKDVESGEITLKAPIFKEPRKNPIFSDLFEEDDEMPF